MKGFFFAKGVGDMAGDEVPDGSGDAEWVKC